MICARRPEKQKGYPCSKYIYKYDTLKKRIPPSRPTGTRNILKHCPQAMAVSSQNLFNRGTLSSRSFSLRSEEAGTFFWHCYQWFEICPNRSGSRIKYYRYLVLKSDI